MRIVHVLHNFPPESVAGVEVHVLRLADVQRLRGHDVLIIAGSEAFAETDLARREQHGDLEVIRLLRTTPGGEDSQSLFSRFHDARLAGLFDEVLSEFRPDVVHVHHLMNLCRSLPGLARRCGARVVVSVHDYWFLCPTLLLQKSDGTACSGPGTGGHCVACLGEGTAAAPALLAKSVLRTTVGKVVLNRADALVVPSAFMVDMLVSEGINRARMRHIPYGVPGNPPINGSLAPEREPDTKVFGYVGSIRPHKGLTELVKAFTGLEEGLRARLDIFGDVERDMTYGRHLQYLAANNSRVRFRGSFSPAQVFDVMRQFDALVVPSLWRETGPQVALEALAAGTPVLGSDRGGLREIVRDGTNGLLFRPGDIEEIRDRMTRLCCNPGLEPASQWDGKAVRTVEKNAAQIESVYQEAMGG